MHLRSLAFTDQLTLLIFVPLLLALQALSETSPDYSPLVSSRTRRQVYGGYDIRQAGPDQLITITFINKSGRRAMMYQSGPYGVEIIYQFSLRPNEPKTIRFLPDGSFWIAYDAKTERELLVNKKRRLETLYFRGGFRYDAKIHSDTLPPAPFAVRNIKPVFIQIFIVLDYSMMHYYGEEEVEKHALTLMNIATRAYMHPSLGVPVFLVVVGIGKMRRKPHDYNIIPNKPDVSVKGGCKYARRFYKKYKYDFAVILTREVIGPSGFASMYTMCTKRSCGLVRVTNLDAGYVIAHELGHALGIDHDEDDRCIHNRGGGNIMARKLYATNSNYRWSRCSKRMLQQNLKYFRCLKNQPKMMKNFKRNMMSLPGEFYNATEQCKFFHGNYSSQCSSRLKFGSCKYLLCHPSKKMACRPSRWHSPLEGSSCGSGNSSWCVHGTCLDKKIMLPVNGNWTKWSKFRPSCASGNGSMLLVQTKYRNCTNPKPRNGGAKCVGDNLMYRVVIPYSNRVCKPYSLKNLITRKKHEKFHKRLERLLGPTNKSMYPDRQFNVGNSMMFPCASSKAKGQKWKEFPMYLQKRYLKSKNFSCNFETPGACSWTSSPLGGKHWTLGSGKTPSYETGPLHDHTFKNKTGKYIFLEASYVENTKPLKRGDRIIFISPLMLASTACLKFAYHMYGKSMGSLEVRVNHGKYSKRMWVKKGAKGIKWHMAEIDLALNIEYNITIEAIRGKSYYSDIAIDDISVTSGLCTNKTLMADECTSICVNTKYTSMLRLQLPNGTPCRNPTSKNNVCLKRECQPVNCKGIVGRKDC